MVRFFLESQGLEPCLRCGGVSISVDPREFRVWAICSGIAFHPPVEGTEELVLETEADRLYVASTWID